MYIFCKYYLFMNCSDILLYSTIIITVIALLMVDNNTEVYIYPTFLSVQLIIIIIYYW